TSPAPAGKLDTSAVTYPRWNFHSERNPLTNTALSRTVATRIGDNITKTATRWASLSRHHATQNGVDRTRDLSGSTTNCTRLWMCSRFHRSPVTAVTADSCLHLDWSLGSAYGILQLTACAA